MTNSYSRHNADAQELEQALAILENQAIKARETMPTKGSPHREKKLNEFKKIMTKFEAVDNVVQGAATNKDYEISNQILHDLKLHNHTAPTTTTKVKLK